MRSTFHPVHTSNAGLVCADNLREYGQGPGDFALQNHEYALVGGMNRAVIGRYITLLASAISAAIVFVLLSAVDLAHRWGWNVNLTPSLLSLFGAAAVFGALYWFFNRFAWRWPGLNAAIKVPNLEGRWTCEGQTINADGLPGHVWQA